MKELPKSHSGRNSYFELKNVSQILFKNLLSCKQIGLEDVMIGTNEDKEAFERVAALDFPSLWRMAKNLFNTNQDTFYPTFQNIKSNFPSMIEGKYGITKIK